MTIAELLNRPSLWCKKAKAFNSKGKICDPWDRDAVQWSVDGAIDLCYRDSYLYSTDHVYRVISQHPKVLEFVSWWNDKQTYQSMMEVITELGV